MVHLLGTRTPPFQFQRTGLYTCTLSIGASRRAARDHLIMCAKIERAFNKVFARARVYAISLVPGQAGGRV